MKNLHIVLPYDSNAMHRMSDPILESEELNKIYHITQGTVPDPLADINYHIPWHTLVGLEMPESKQVMLYTHCNRGAEAQLVDACRRADRILCMSFTGKQELLDLGVEANKLWVVYAPAGDLPLRRKNIGVIGFRQPNGRKREHILLDLLWQLDPKISAMLHFMVVGGGMKELCEEILRLGGSVDYYENLKPDQLTQVYHQLDMLLVTGYVEGGPLPVLEAMSSGVPVMAPHVGFANDFMPEAELYTTIEDLSHKIETFVKPSINNFYLSRLLSKALYVREHAIVFGDLTDTHMEVEVGAERYRQLLKIIEEHKIKTIVEIGTWNGERAVQMIQQVLRFSSKHGVMYTGYDLFEQQTTEQLIEEYSKEACPMDVVARRLKPTGVSYGLVPGNTRKTLRKHTPTADLYFIDGGHSIETIQSDWACVQTAMWKDSIVVFDDLYFPRQDGFGCNEIIDSIDRDLFSVEILPGITLDKDHEIHMVKVVPTNADLRLFVQTKTSAGDYSLNSYGSGGYMPNVSSGYAPSAPASKSKLGWIASAFGALTRSWRKTVA